MGLGSTLTPTLSLSSGKFGAVCTCTEKATGLKLAAKVIKKQTPKDKVAGECRPYHGRCSRIGHLLSPATHSAGLGPWCEKLVAFKMPHKEKGGGHSLLQP